MHQKKLFAFFSGIIKTEKKQERIHYQTSKKYNTQQHTKKKQKYIHIVYKNKYKKQTKNNIITQNAKNKTEKDLSKFLFLFFIFSKHIHYSLSNIGV